MRRAGGKQSPEPSKSHFPHSQQTYPKRLRLYIHLSATRKSSADRGRKEIKTILQAGSNMKDPKSMGEPPTLALRPKMQESP